MLRFNSFFSANGSRNYLYSIPIRSILYLGWRCLFHILLWCINLIIDDDLILWFDCFLGSLSIILLIGLNFKVRIFVHNVLHDTRAIQIVSGNPIILWITVRRCYYFCSGIGFYRISARIGANCSCLLRISVWISSRYTLFTLFS